MSASSVKVVRRDSSSRIVSRRGSVARRRLDGFSSGELSDAEVGYAVPSQLAAQLWRADWGSRCMRCSWGRSEARRVRGWLALGLITLVGALSVGVGGARAAATVVLRPSFSSVGHASEVLAAGRYAFAGATGYLDGSQSVVIDERTGARRVFESGGCAPFAFGGPWLLAQCGPQGDQAAVYAPATGERRVLPPLPGDAGHPVAVGAHWVEFQNVVPCPLTCQFSYTFENVNTGAVRRIAYREGGNTIPDLGSPRLSRRLCRPLRVPRGPGSLTFLGGSFAVAEYGRTHEGVWDYLERCGTSLHRSVPVNSIGLPDAQVAGNANVLLWLGQGYLSTEHPALHGLFLPSLQPFTIFLPTKIDLGATGGFVQVAMSTKRLYVLDGEEQLWSAPAPMRRR